MEVATVDDASNGQKAFDPVRQLTVWVVGCVVAVVVLIMGSISLMAYQLAAQPVSDEVAKMAQVVAKSVSATLSQAQGMGIDPARMPGIAQRIGELQRETPGIAGISVAVGDVVHQAGVSGAASAPTAASEPGQLVSVRAEADPNFARRVVTELATDFAFILVAVVFVTIELTHALLGKALLQPVNRLVQRIRQGPSFASPSATVPSVLRGQLPQLNRLMVAKLASRVDASTPLPPATDQHSDSEALDAGLRGLRLPFFLVLFAEDLSRSFLPSLSAGLSSNLLDISPAIAAGFPLAVFMLCVALAQPLCSGWIERWGSNRVLLISAALAAIAHGLTAFQTELVAMTLCRAAGGVAWALAFMVVQSEIMTHAPPRLRLATLGIFVSVIMVSLVCAPQIGGVLADAHGKEVALGTAAALCALAAFLAARRLRFQAAINLDVPASALVHNAIAETTATSVPLALLKNGHFLALIVLSAMPAKLLLVGYCFYFAPIAMADAGYSAAMAGRLMMLYGLLMILCMPLVTGLTEFLRPKFKESTLHALVSAGMLLSGIAGLLVGWIGGLLGIAMAMALLGVAQALSTTPQATAIQHAASAEIRVHGNNAVFAYYRLLERTGSALGPLTFGALIAMFGSPIAIQGVALISMMCGLLLVALTVLHSRRRDLPFRGSAE